MSKSIRYFLVIVLVIVLGSNSGEVFASPLAPQGDRPGVTYLEDGLLLEWAIPPASITIEADRQTHVRIPGFELETEPGALEMPYASSLITLPAGSTPVLEIVQSGGREVALAAPLARVQLPEKLTLPDGNPLPEGYQRAIKALPSQPIEMVEMGTLRGVRLAQVILYPVLQKGNALQITTNIKVQIHFNTTAPLGAKIDDATAESVVKQVINPAQAVISQPEMAVAPLVSNELAGAGKVAIEISQPGIYRVDYAGLAATGYAVNTVNPLNFHITHAGQDVAYEWEGDNDTLFETDESLLFFGQPRATRWSNYDVYFLANSGAPGPLFPSQSAAPNGPLSGKVWLNQTFESNTYYTPDCLCAPVPMGRDGDRWIWDRLTRSASGGGETAKSFPFTVSNPNSSGSNTLTIWLIGYTDVPASPDHKVSVKLNNTLLGTIEWNGKIAIERQFSIPAGVLLAGANSLDLSLPGLGVDESLWLDAFSIQFEPGSAALPGKALFTGESGTNRAYQLRLNSTSGVRVYDVTTPQTPVIYTGFNIAADVVSFQNKSVNAQPRFMVVTNSTILVPDRLRLAAALQTQATTGVNYVIISPDLFTPALPSLAALRTSQGMQVVREDTQAIYDWFGEGFVTPEAIQAFLKDAYTRWNPKPTYVLLVGDGSNDPKKYYTTSFDTFIPPFLADFDKDTTENATDNRFVTLDGPNDFLPEMLIGRLPVNSLVEATTMINKIVQYETNPPAGDWNRTATFIADRLVGADFNAYIKQESGMLSCTQPTTSILSSFYSPVTTLRPVLFNKWNTGTSLIVYHGHASRTQWGLDNIFHASDIPTLTNNNKLPVILSMTCYTGTFHNRAFSGMDEALARAPNGGSLASWGDVSLGFPSGHTILAQGFISKVVSTKSPTRLGQAALNGKLLVLAKMPAYVSLVDSFHLFGDPATNYVLPHVIQCQYIPKLGK